MNDRDVIAEAYQTALKEIYAAFSGACISAADDIAKQQAEQRFVRGVTTARQTRDRALAILPKE